MIRFLPMITFLRLNGLETIATEIDYYETMMKIASGQMTKEQLAQWLQAVTQGVAARLE